jgi:hypothetical protein
MLRFSTLVHIPAVLVAGSLVISALPVAAATRTIAVPSFTGVAIDSSLVAKITVGGPQAITVEGAGDANLDKLRLEVTDGRLLAHIERDFWDYVTLNDPRITVSITVPALSEVKASAASDVDVSGLKGEELRLDASSAARLTVGGVDADKLHLSATSAGQLMLDGNCVVARVELSSGASIGGEGLECVDLDIDASSAGRAVLFATGQVNASASSGAEVRLAGHPNHVDDEENSGGNVELLN